jgi:hypothetical protein
VKRPLALAGLATAIASGVLATVLLVSPSEESAPPTLDQVAPAPLVLPNDPPHRAAMPGAQLTLADGTRVRVPRLRINLPLEPGDSARDIQAQATPAAAAYLLPGGAVPGAAGNAYVYAHARPGLFLALWDVRLGDAIEVTEPTGVALRYAVTEIHPRVAPSDLAYIAPTNDERLTLQTSTGSWTLSPRFIVVARPVP